jgi:hypothetical protein
MQRSRQMIFAVAIFAVSGCKAWERPKSRYATRAEAVSAGAFDGGWLPQLVPASAHGLVEQHDVDTNETWLSFDWWPSTLTRANRVAEVDLFSCSEDGFHAFLAVHSSLNTAWFWRLR